MTFNQQMWWWGTALAVLVLLLWLLADALLPFLLGAAIAYLTDPLADRLERIGLSRLMATVVITLASLGVVAIGLLLVVPLLIEQLRDLIAAVPVWFEQLHGPLRNFLPELGSEETGLRQAVGEMSESLKTWGLEVVRGALAGGVAVIGFLAVLVVTPVVAFYLLMDWDRLIKAIDDYLPLEHRTTIRAIARDLDRALSGF
ncbi:MAG TPA: AI-2E family transporter, partial [Paracoccaceae bacterium]|nr:AI-2E family transporter [Paracoccaceae bacterium]